MHAGTNKSRPRGCSRATTLNRPYRQLKEKRSSHHARVCDARRDYVKTSGPLAINCLEWTRELWRTESRTSSSDAR